MPSLDEYQSKQLVSKAGLRVPRGRLASTAREARDIAEWIGGHVVLKAQLPTTGRLGIGGVRFADDPTEAERIAESLLRDGVGTFKVTSLLVEEELKIEVEFFAGVIVSDSYKVKGPVIMFSTEGGTGIEDIAVRCPEKVASMSVDILTGPIARDVEDLISGLGVGPDALKPLRESVCTLYKVFRECDARSAEVNPLALTASGQVYAVDCRIVVDEASVFRHAELGVDFPRDLGRGPTCLERIAWEVEKEDYRGTGYFAQMAEGFQQGQRYVGFHGLGGGGAMLSADALIGQGLQLADYADTSGNPTASKVYRIAKIILSQPNIDGYAVMGPGIANQDQWHTALGLVRALREELPGRPGFPVVILLAGNKEAESLEIIREGLKDLPARIEVFGHEHVARVDYVAQRMRALVDQYVKEREGSHE